MPSAGRGAYAGLLVSKEGFIPVPHPERLGGGAAVASKRRVLRDGQQVSAWEQRAAMGPGYYCAVFKGQPAACTGRVETPLQQVRSGLSTHSLALLCHTPLLAASQLRSATLVVMP
jgi:hypothetical protein